MRFQPGKQIIELRVTEGYRDVWLALMGDVIKATPVPPPSYANFWIWSVGQVRGRVIDYFRSEKLITRVPKSKNGDAPKRQSMLYKDRFLSASNPLFNLKTNSSDGNSLAGSFLDLFPSRDFADREVVDEDRRKQVKTIMEKAELDGDEAEVVELYYSDQGLAKKDIAGMYGRSPTWVSATLKSALQKMQSVAQVVA